MKRPNILFIYTDQLRWDAIGPNGNPDVRTPALDAMAAQGVNFEHCFVQNPVCMPSRVSCLTGQYPSTLSITHMGVPVPPETVTLPKMLRPFGYVTANIGKLHFMPHANRDHREIHPDYGFDYLEISDEPGCYEDAYRAWVRRKAPDQLDSISPGLPPMAQTWYRAMRVQDTVVHPEVRHSPQFHALRARSDLTHASFVAEQSLEFIRTHREQPWLCIASFYSPHSPWIAPQEFLDLYDPSQFTLPAFPPEVDAQRPGSNYTDDLLRVARHGYYAMVSEVDHHVGRLVACLDDLGLAQDTVIVFTSDHGDWLGEHLRQGKGYPGPDPVSRVPLVVRWPQGVRSPGRTAPGIAEAVDVVPTLLECAGVPVPPQVQGRSLLPVLEGRERSGRDSALMEQRGWKSLRTTRYRYLCESSGKESLWDLERDSGEYVDVAGDPAYGEVLSEMRGRLLRRVIENEQPLPRAWSY